MNNFEGHYNKKEKNGGCNNDSLWDSFRNILPSPDSTPNSCHTPKRTTPWNIQNPTSVNGMLIGLLVPIIGMYIVVFLVGSWWSEFATQQRIEQKQRIEHESQKRQQHLAHDKKEQERIERANSTQVRNTTGTNSKKQVSKINTPPKTETAPLKPTRKVSPNHIEYIVSDCNIGDIPANKYAYCRDLESVDIECRSIGRNAFLSCTALTKVTVRAGLTQVSNKAFAECYSLKIILLPKTVHEMGKNVFADTKRIVEISIPYKVREQLCDQTRQCDRINTLYILSDTFFKMPNGLKENKLSRQLAKLYVPDALLADFCKDPEWILFNEILPLSQSPWYDANGKYKKD